ncbi:GTPase Der [Synergistales bacterium]|nr:GTPase Der [Synergistales bacterium]
MGIIAIVGRPNVGKSSIFNRLLGRRAAIVDDFPGVTRDRLYGEMLWDGHGFYLVDTGGIMGENDESLPGLPERIQKQVMHAIDESDGVIFVVDGREGVTVMDEEIASMLRKGGRKVALAVNKLDNPDKLDAAYDAASLGFKHVIPVSAEHNFNMGDLLEVIVSFLTGDGNAEDAESSDEIPVALVGRPNVGKSSLLNALAGEERSIVSEIPGTTRDVVDSVVETDGAKFRFLDTAGLRRRSRVAGNVEYYSNVRTYQAIDRCRIAVMMLDAGELATEQDKRLIGQITERGKGLVVAVNKWDLLKGGERAGDEMRARLKEELPFVPRAPTVFISSLTGRNVPRIAERILTVDENRRRRISTSELNRLVRDVLAFERMPGEKGRYLKISYCTQANGVPPAFIFFVNDSSLVSRPFHRRVENLLRGMADFSGVPLKLFFRNKGRDEER